MALFSPRRRQTDIDEKQQPTQIDENKIPKLNLNNKKMKDFVLKAIGGIQKQSDARERFQRPEYNLWEIKEASESDSYVKIAFSKYSYLPESHTDFAFAVFCQEMGFIGALIIFLLLIAMAFYFIKIALRTKDNFGKMLVCGIMLLIVGQAAGNIAMVVGLLPVIGFPLPFISYGGTSLILNMTCMGLVISVDRHNRKNTSVTHVSPPNKRYIKNR